jgi:hypothetical protein
VFFCVYLIKKFSAVLCKHLFTLFFVAHTTVKLLYKFIVAPCVDKVLSDAVVQL